MVGEQERHGGRGGGAGAAGALGLALSPSQPSPHHKQAQAQQPPTLPPALLLRLRLPLAASALRRVHMALLYAAAESDTDAVAALLAALPVPLRTPLAVLPHAALYAAEAAATALAAAAVARRAAAAVAESNASGSSARRGPNAATATATPTTNTNTSTAASASAMASARRPEHAEEEDSVFATGAGPTALARGGRSRSAMPRSTPASARSSTSALLDMAGSVAHNGTASASTSASATASLRPSPHLPTAAAAATSSNSAHSHSPLPPHLLEAEAAMSAAQAQAAQGEAAREATALGAPSDLVLRTVLYTAAAFHAPDVLELLLGSAAAAAAAASIAVADEHGGESSRAMATGADLAAVDGARGHQVAAALRRLGHEAAADADSDDSMDDAADDAFGIDGNANGDGNGHGEAPQGASQAANEPGLAGVLAALAEAEAAVSVLMSGGADCRNSELKRLVLAAREEENARCAFDTPASCAAAVGAPALTVASPVVADQARGEAQSAVALCLARGLTRPLHLLLDSAHLPLGLELVFNATRAHNARDMARYFLAHPRFRHAHTAAALLAERVATHPSGSSLLLALLEHTSSPPVLHAATRLVLQSKVADEEFLLATLLHPKLSIYKLNSSGYGIFHLACQLRKPHAVSVLLQRRDLDVNALTANGKDGLRLACYRGRLETVKLLLADPRLNTVASNERSGDPILWACRSESRSAPAVLQLLLADPRFDPSRMFHSGITAAHCAADTGSLQLLGLLLGDGRVDWQQATRYGQTPLMVACCKGHDAAASLLMTRSITPDLNVTDADGHSALHYAYAANLSEITTSLVSLGADPTLRDKNGRTPPEMSSYTPPTLPTLPNIDVLFNLAFMAVTVSPSPGDEGDVASQQLQRRRIHHSGSNRRLHPPTALDESSGRLPRRSAFFSVI